MSTTADHPLTDIGSRNVSDDSPCGENARYEPDFEQLEAELAKQESLTSATVDWGKIIDLSAQITQNKSKDILVGAYLCYGLLLKENYAGLAVGLKILCDMSETHWDCLFPPAKRMRARATAFVWLAEKAGVVIGEKTPGPADSAAVIEAADYLKKLDGILVDKMGDQAPMLTDLARPLKGYRQSAEAEQAKAAPPAPEPEAPPAPAAAEPSAPAEPAAAQPAATAPPPTPPPAPAPTTTPSAEPAAPSTTLETVSLESEADSKKNLRQIQAACRDTAAFWLQQKLSDPRAYRLARTAVWMVVENAPPASDGVTQLVGPAAERLKFFQGKLEKNEYSALLPELEKTLARAPFWLDGQFMAAQCLKALGAEYDNALQTVIRETASLLKRLPELIDLSFTDNTPFVADQTKLWLQSEVLSGDSNADGGERSAGGGDAWAVALSAASKLAASGDTEQALKIMDQGLKQAGSQRSQLYWRCALAELLAQTGQAESASDLLEQVTAQLDSNPNAAWEPELQGYAYRLLYQAYLKQQKKKKDDQTLQESAQKAYAKLCWFDPVTALSVKGG